MSYSWNEFIKEVAKYKFEYPWMNELIVAQSIIEAGRGIEELPKNHCNWNGMKYRKELEKFGGTKFKYFTESEPFRDEEGNEVPEGTPGAKRWDWFFEFKHYKDSIATWANWWKRTPYPKVIANDPSVMKDMKSFLEYIGPIYCPNFTKTHSESYASYIINRCLPEAIQKLKEVVNDPVPQEKSYRGELDPTTLNYRIIEEPGAKVYAVVNTDKGTNKQLWPAIKAAQDLGAYRTLVTKWDDGKVEPKPEPKPDPKKDFYLKVIRTGRVENNLEKLLLTMEGSTEKWFVNSGAPGKQVFLQGGTGELPQTLYPAPEGKYTVEDISWAGGKDNYDASHGEGLGPVFVPFEPQFNTKRGAFGFHLDSNRANSPGSAGCMVFSTLDDLKSFVAALRKYDPKLFVVDWGLRAPSSFEVIEQGDSGSRVEALQSELNRVFTNVLLVTDGKFGPKTYEAVLLFQKLVSLDETGKVNEGTWNKLKATANESLSKPGEPVPQPGKKTLIIPWATQVEPYKTSWDYEKGYPRGLVVHFTATGPTPEQEEGVDEYMRPRWSVFMLKRSGELCQTFPLNKGGAHCGTWHHDVCLGVEIVAAGRCTPVTLNGQKKYAPWYAYKDGVLKYPEMCFDESQMRYSGPNKVKNIYPGWYQTYTQKQEDTLFNLCMFLKDQAPDIFDFDLVVGHDEACDVGGRPGAKNDPGAALSLDMPAFRQKLKQAWESSR